MRVIYKYMVSTDHDLILRLDNPKVVMVGADQPGDLEPTIWIEHYNYGDEYEDEWDDEEAVTYTIIGTGHPIPNSYKHVGSCKCADGRLTWHVYEAPQ